MYSDSRFQWRPIALFAIGVAILAFVPTTARAGSCVGDTDFQDVKITLEDGELSVDRVEVTIYMGSKAGGKKQKICWHSDDLGKGQWMFIKTDPTKYPKGDRTPDKTEKFRGNFKRSFSAATGYRSSGRPIKDGTWHYKLWIEKENGDVIGPLDPRVVIVDTDRPGSGG